MQSNPVRYVLVREEPPHPQHLLDALAGTIVGQRETLRTIVLTLVAGGHVLLEGPPGVAKTRMCRALAAACDAAFARLQFTPDLLPGDIIGTRIFDQRVCEFRTVTGPIFANIVLADEINRAPANVQSALLEAMEEGSVTIASQTHALPRPFFVLATMNAHDVDGTYALTLAQLDRFLASVRLTYPSAEEEQEILRRFSTAGFGLPTAVASRAHLCRWSESTRAVRLSDEIRQIIVAIVMATRPHERLPPQLREYVEAGAGPRATLAIARLAQARAFLERRDAASLEDVRTVAGAALRHRISYTLEAEGRTCDDVTARIIDSVLR